MIEIKKKPIKAKNYTYEIETIERYIKLVLFYSLSLNSASRILPLIHNLKRQPSINSGKMWMLKLGYYNLTKEQTIADDWIYIIDHSIQMGNAKLLVILGIRTKDLPKDRALKYEDTEIIDLQPVKNSTGEVVFQQIKEASKKTGKPRAIVSDMGSDIKLGVRKFRENFMDTVHIYDLKHKIAILIKNILEKDDNWNEFKKFLNYIVKKLQNTSIAGYRPPKQKEKARYMNIENLVHWGEQILLKKVQLQNKQVKTDDDIKLEGIIKYIVNFEKNIEAWSEMVRMFKLIERFMNIHNLQNNSYEKFYELHKNELLKLKTDEAKKLSEEILTFIKEQQKVCNENERLLHSSQILESLFGKFKFLEKEQSKNSFTSLILSIGAMVSKITADILKKALETINIDMINKWCKEIIGITVQVQRKELYELEKVDVMEQKQDSKLVLNVA